MSRLGGGSGGWGGSRWVSSGKDAQGAPALSASPPMAVSSVPPARGSARLTHTPAVGGAVDTEPQQAPQYVNWEGETVYVTQVGQGMHAACFWCVHASVYV